MPYRIISADSHFVEPPDMWGERMDKKFRERAPHTVRGNDGKEGEFFVCENITPVPVAGFFGSGKSAEELPEHNKKGFEVAPKSVWDPAERLKEQDRDGVSAEALSLYFDGDAAIRVGRRRVEGGLLPRLQRLRRRVLQSQSQASPWPRHDRT